MTYRFRGSTSTQRWSFGQELINRWYYRFYKLSFLYPPQMSFIRSTLTFYFIFWNIRINNIACRVHTEYEFQVRRDLVYNLLHVYTFRFTTDTSEINVTFIFPRTSRADEFRGLYFVCLHTMCILRSVAYSRVRTRKPEADVSDSFEFDS